MHLFILECTNALPMKKIPFALLFLLLALTTAFYPSTSFAQDGGFVSVNEQTLTVANDPNGLYRIVIYNDATSQKQIGFDQKMADGKFSGEPKRIDNVFTAETALSEFTYLDLNQSSVLHFKANDAIWSVSYYWNLANNELNYIVKGNNTGKTIKSKSLATPSKLNTNILAHYNGKSFENAITKGEDPIVKTENTITKTENPITKTENTVVTKTQNTIPKTQNTITKTENTVIIKTENTVVTKTETKIQPQPSLNATTFQGVSLKVEDYFKSTRIFTLAIENTTPQAVVFKNVRVYIQITGNGYNKEHFLYEMPEISLGARNNSNTLFKGYYDVIEDGFVAMGTNSQYVLYRSNKEETNFLPKINNGNYQMKVNIYTNNGSSVVRSNTIGFSVPLL